MQGVGSAKKKLDGDIIWYPQKLWGYGYPHPNGARIYYPTHIPNDIPPLGMVLGFNQEEAFLKKERQIVRECAPPTIIVKCLIIEKKTFSN